MAIAVPFSRCDAEETVWGPEQQGAVDAGQLKRHDLGYALPIFSLDLHRSDGSINNLRRYYGICEESTELMVTTSCFAAWKQGKFKNGCAKVIPAVPADSPHAAASRKVRVFFFDDNINLHLGSSAGSSDAKGICNLRDVDRGDYVDFSEGKNGFRRDTAFRHTLIHHSSKYNDVMVQVNILDAMYNADYFTSIIKRFSQANEKLVVYMDVNGTILWDDTIMGLGQEEVLLSTMMSCIEVRPRASLDFVWDAERTVRLELEKPKTLKQLVYDVADEDKAFYRNFWTLKNCERLLADLVPLGEIGWTSGETPQKASLTPQGFSDLYHSYMEEMQKQVGAQGMTASWFRCLDMLREGHHAAILQSFGMDTHRVVRHSVDDEQKVLHLAVNVELWSERDRRMFAEQFNPLDPAVQGVQVKKKTNTQGVGSETGGARNLLSRFHTFMTWGYCCQGQDS